MASRTAELSRLGDLKANASSRRNRQRSGTFARVRELPRPTDPPRLVVIGCDQEVGPLQAWAKQGALVFTHVRTVDELLGELQPEPRIVVIVAGLPDVQSPQVIGAARVICPHTSILWIAGSPDPENEALAFEAGADQVLCAPYERRTLFARLQSMSRRAERQRHRVLRWGPIEVDVARHATSTYGVLRHLSKQQEALLVLLIEADGSVVTQNDIAQRIFEGRVVTNPRRLPNALKRARERAGEFVKNKRGVGWFLDNS